MDAYNDALRLTHLTLKDLTANISTICKALPSNSIPADLTEVHCRLKALTSNRRIPDSTLPTIKFKKRLKTQEAPKVMINTSSKLMSSNIRKKYKLNSDTPEPQRLHSGQRYQRPQFSRLSKAKVIPRATRQDTIANPATPSQEDFDQGLYSMVNKGLVSKHTDLLDLLESPLLESKKMVLQTFSSRFDTPISERKTFTTSTKIAFKPKRPSPPTPDALSILDLDSQIPTKKDQQVTEEINLNFLLSVKKGRLKHDKAFMRFKEEFHTKWTSMNETMEAVEGYCTKLRYPKVVVDGRRLFETAVNEVNGLSMRGFKQSIVNQKEIETNAGLRRVIYRGRAGKHLAALKIQTAYRCFFAARQFRYLKSLNARARVIQAYFRLYLNKLSTKSTIKNIKAQRIHEYNKRQQDFKASWPDLSRNHRIEIHLGSLIPDVSKKFFYTSQNTQILRIFKLTDPKLSIIYVSPVELHHDITEYYYSVLELCKIPNARSRLTFLTPAHGLCLKSLYSTSKLLFLSSPSINYIKSSIKDKVCYIVPNELSIDDIWLSDVFRVPILAGELDMISELSTHEGFSKFFQENNIKIPLQVTGITTPEIFYQELALLIFNNLEKDVWVVKINNESKSRGIAYLDVNKMKTIPKIRKIEVPNEKHLNQIHEELVKALGFIIKIVMSSLWENFDSFLRAFCAKGGVIQETPDNKGNAAYPCISVLVEPDGGVKCICAADRMQSTDYVNSGSFFNQSSLPYSKILEIAYNTGKSLYTHNIIGYILIELLAFPDPYNDGGLPAFWGIGLKFHLDPITCSFFMFHLLSDGFIDNDSGKYYIDFEEASEDEYTITEDVFGDNFTNLITTTNPMKTRSGYTQAQLIELKDMNRKDGLDDLNRFDQRCFFYCWHAEHPDLKDLGIGGLFHMCRLESITYNIETCKGSALAIYGPLSDLHFGVMGIGSDRQDSIRTVSEMFSFILQQAGPPPQLRVAYTGMDNYNLTELITKVKSIHKTLEKINKSRMKSYLVDLL